MTVPPLYVLDTRRATQRNVGLLLMAGTYPALDVGPLPLMCYLLPAVLVPLVSPYQPAPVGYSPESYRQVESNTTVRNRQWALSFPTSTGPIEGELFSTPGLGER